MLVDVNYSAVGGLIEKILDIVKPIPKDASETEREELDEWRQMYVSSSHFAQWNIKTLQKFHDRIEGQKQRGEKIKDNDFSNL